MRYMAGLAERVLSRGIWRPRTEGRTCLLLCFWCEQSCSLSLGTGYTKRIVESGATTECLAGRGFEEQDFTQEDETEIGKQYQAKTALILTVKQSQQR